MTIATQKDQIKQDILSNFTVDIDPRIDKFLESVLKAVEYTNNIEYKKNALILLVTQLILYFKASDSLVATTNIGDNNKYLRLVGLLQGCNDKILRIMNDLGCSPLQDAKISKLKEKSNTKQDASELLAALVN